MLLAIARTSLRYLALQASAPSWSERSGNHRIQTKTFQIRLVLHHQRDVVARTAATVAVPERVRKSARGEHGPSDRSGPLETCTSPLGAQFAALLEVLGLK